jgi:DNA-directed RNA polymerase subunit RPC12/RpoP
MDEQGPRDKWERKVSVPCPKCGKTAARPRREQVEQTNELVGITCQHCGHHFDWIVPDGI